MTAPEARSSTFGLDRRAAAEALGTALLLAIVVGSGIMGERLAGGNVAVALLANALATGAGLVVLVTVFGPISGAHLNPVVTLGAWIDRAMTGREVAAYLAAQVVGAVAGVAAAHGMFGEPVFVASTHERSALGLVFAEVVATFGLIVAIRGAVRWRPSAVPWVVATYIVAAYWFTASTSFANPAVTLARALTDTFAGIRPADVPAFVVAQLVGATLAVGTMRWFFRGERAAARGGER